MASASFRSPSAAEVSADRPSSQAGVATSAEDGERDVADRLRAAGVSLTLQRLAIARVLLPRPVHLTADEVWGRARELLPEISRATVYNTLDLFERSGLLRRFAVDAEKVVFDSDPTPHPHIHDIDSGELYDVVPGELQVVGLPHLPMGTELEQVDVVLRVRRRAG